MVTDILDDWKSAFNDIPNVMTQAEGVQNLSDWIESHVTGKLVLDPSIIVGTGITYTWNKEAFKAELLSLSNSPTPNGLASAWKASVEASIMSVPAGASVGAPSPATTFSAPPVTVLDATSVTTAFSQLQVSLNSLPPANTKEEVQIPELLRTAFLTLTFTLSGTNSVSPPAGPNPLTSPNTPVK